MEGYLRPGFGSFLAADIELFSHRICLKKKILANKAKSIRLAIKKIIDW